MEVPEEDKLSSSTSMPLILVSARDEASANVLITEIINSNAQEESKTQNKSESKIWKIENKYYTVEVELYPLPDNDTLPLSLADRLEAHIIYVAEDEEDEAAPSLAEERWARAGAEAREADVRVLARAAAHTAPALAAWARRRRYEPVPLRDAPAPADASGVRRVREALHAHAWRGLRRVDARGGAEDEAEAFAAALGALREARAEDEAEAFAAALGALREAREAGAALPAAERRRAAERHTLAFLRSIGVDVHTI